MPIMRIYANIMRILATYITAILPDLKKNAVTSFALIRLTLPALCISESCIKIKINLNFFFFCENKNLSYFCLCLGSGRKELIIGPSQGFNHVISHDLVV